MIKTKLFMQNMLENIIYDDYNIIVISSSSISSSISSSSSTLFNINAIHFVN